MTTIGQNSPATPVPSTARPSGVEQPGVGENRDERAERGRRKRDPEQPAFGVYARRPAAEAEREPSATEITQPTVPRTSERRGTCFSITSRPAKKNRKTSPKLGKKLDVGVGLRPAEHLRADQDPEHDLDHDGRQHEPVMNPRKDRPRPPRR